MAQQTQVAQPSDFIVDFARDGIANALWKFFTGAGALAGTTPDRGRFNADDAVVRADCLHGIFEFAVRFPTTGVQTPSSLANDVSFGLKNQPMGNLGKVDVFVNKIGNSITFRTYDEFGTLQSTTLAWATAWNSALTIFRIGWDKTHVSLDVLASGGTAYTNLANHTTSIPKRALNPFITVVGNDNFDVDFLAVRNTQHSSIMLI